MVTVFPDLEELISITQENLLELKRKEILAQFPDSDDDEEEPEMTPLPEPEVATEPDVEEDDVDEEIDLSSLEGLKCRAPHITSQSGTFTKLSLFGIFEIWIDFTNFCFFYTKFTQPYGARSECRNVILPKGRNYNTPLLIRQSPLLLLQSQKI